MHVGALLVLIGMLQGKPAAPQATDSTPPDTSRTPGVQIVLRRSLLRQLPIDDPRDALTLTPGFVRRGTAFGIGAGTGLHFRGSGTDAASVYIDGVPVRDQITGRPGLTLPLDAIETIAITPGPPEAAIADGAGGGLIDYAIRTGGAHFEGNFRAATDAPFNAAARVGYNRFAAAGGGPLGSRVSWFAAGEVTGQGAAYRGWGANKQPAFVWGGVDTVVDSVAVPTFLETTGLRRPLDWITERRAVGKVTIAAGAGSRLGITGVMNDVQQRFFPGADIGDTALFSGARTDARLVVASWMKSFGQRAVSALHVVASLGHDGSSSGLLTAVSQRATADPALGIEWSSLAFLGSDSIPQVTDRLIRNIRSNAGLRVPFLNQTSLRLVQPYRLNPYGLISGWPTHGTDGMLSHASENRFNGRLWLETAIASRQHVEMGVDYNRLSQRMYQTSGLLSEIGLDAWIAHPRRIGLFGADRVDWGKVSLSLGARYDHFTPGGVLPIVPGRMFSNPAWGSQTATDDTAYAASLARVAKTASGQNAVSPRLRVVFHASHRTVLRFDAGQTTEPPSSALVFGGSNADLSFTSLSTAFGRDVKYARVATAELGVDQQVATRFLVHVEAYHTTRALYPYRIMPFDDPANPGSNLNVSVLTSVDSIAANGLEGGLAWSPSAAMSGRLVYSYEHSAGFSAQAINALILLATPSTRYPLLRDLTVVGTFEARSGLPYIPGLATVPNGEDEFPLFSIIALQRLPWTSTIDLRVHKTVTLAHFSGSLFADVRNALNFRNVTGAYVRTGSQTDSLYETTVLSPEFAALHVEAQANGVLLGGNAIDLRPDCSTWTATTAGPIDCTVLRSVERRFGNGDGVYDLSEQTTALNAYFDAFFGAWRFYAPGRTARVGVELDF